MPGRLPLNKDMSGCRESCWLIKPACRDRYFAAKLGIRNYRTAPDAKRTYETRRRFECFDARFIRVIREVRQITHHISGEWRGMCFSAHRAMAMCYLLEVSPVGPAHSATKTTASHRNSPHLLLVEKIPRACGSGCNEEAKRL